MFLLAVHRHTPSNVVTKPTESACGHLSYAGRLDVGDDKLLQVISNRSLAGLASLFGKAETGLVSRPIEVGSSQFGNGSDTSGGVRQQRRERFDA